MLAFYALKQLIPCRTEGETKKLADGIEGVLE